MGKFEGKKERELEELKKGAMMRLRGGDGEPVIKEEEQEPELDADGNVIVVKQYHDDSQRQ